jgi:hypothetical protein
VEHRDLAAGQGVGKFQNVPHDNPLDNRGVLPLKEHIYAVEVAIFTNQEAVLVEATVVEQCTDKRSVGDLATDKNVATSRCCANKASGLSEGRESTGH